MQHFWIPFFISIDYYGFFSYWVCISYNTCMLIFFAIQSTLSYIFLFCRSACRFSLRRRRITSCRRKSCFFSWIFLCVVVVDVLRKWWWLRVWWWLVLGQPFCIPDSGCVLWKPSFLLVPTADNNHNAEKNLRPQCEIISDFFLSSKKKSYLRSRAIYCLKERGVRKKT